MPNLHPPVAATFSGILFKTHLLGWDWYDMSAYRMAITSTQKHECPSKATPWALCTQPRSAVWGHFTPRLRIIHTSKNPYFWYEPVGVDSSVTYQPQVWTYVC